MEPEVSILTSNFKPPSKRLFFDGRYDSTNGKILSKKHFLQAEECFAYCLWRQFY